MKKFWFIIYLLLFIVGFVMIWLPQIFGMSSNDFWPKLIVTIVLAIALLLQRFWQD